MSTEARAAEIKPVTGLADPQERPNADVVIWDGKCNFCRQQVERLNRFDFAGRLAYLSLHDPRVRQQWPEFTKAQLMKQMWVMTPRDEQFGGADAIRYLSRKVIGLWWLMPLLYIPFTMPIWRWMYSKVADRRYIISGEACDDGTCKLHQK